MKFSPSLCPSIWSYLAATPVDFKHLRSSCCLTACWSRWKLGAWWHPYIMESWIVWHSRAIPQMFRECSVLVGNYPGTYRPASCKMSIITMKSADKSLMTMCRVEGLDQSIQALWQFNPAALHSGWSLMPTQPMRLTRTNFSGTCPWTFFLWKLHGLHLANQQCVWVGCLNTFEILRSGEPGWLFRNPSGWLLKSELLGCLGQTSLRMPSQSKMVAVGHTCSWRWTPSAIKSNIFLNTLLGPHLGSLGRFLDFLDIFGPKRHIEWALLPGCSELSWGMGDRNESNESNETNTGKLLEPMGLAFFLTNQTHKLFQLGPQQPTSCLTTFFRRTFGWTWQLCCIFELWSLWSLWSLDDLKLRRFFWVWPWLPWIAQQLLFTRLPPLGINLSTQSFSFVVQPAVVLAVQFSQNLASHPHVVMRIPSTPSHPATSQRRTSPTSTMTWLPPTRPRRWPRGFVQATMSCGKVLPKVSLVLHVVFFHALPIFPYFPCF